MKLLFAVLFSGCCTLTQAGQTCTDNCKLTRSVVAPVARVLRMTQRESPERVVRVVTEKVVQTTKDMPRFEVADVSEVSQPRLLERLVDRPRREQRRLLRSRETERTLTSVRGERRIIRRRF